MGCEDGAIAVADYEGTTGVRRSAVRLPWHELTPMSLSMITATPTDDQLRRADSIVLVDPSHPGWVMPIYSADRPSSNQRLCIPVDSTDYLAHRAWLERVRHLASAQDSPGGNNPPMDHPA